MRTMFAFLACAALLTTGAAVAGELAGVTLDDGVTVEGKTLTLNGMGLRRAYGIAKVYVAGLYLEKKTANPREILESDATRRIELRFVRNVGRDDIAKAWTEGFEKNAGSGLAALRERLDTLNRAMPDVRVGDVLSFTALPGKGVVVEVKGRAEATIPGADFTKALFSIWLGPDPPNAALKSGLLGGG
jgi:hypothetical protein